MSQIKLLEKLKEPVRCRPSHYVFPGIVNKPKIDDFLFVQEIIISLGTSTPNPIDAVNMIIYITFGMSESQLKTKSRKPEVVFPRQVGMFLLNLLGYTLSFSGQYYGKDHCTALHAKRKRCFNLLETKDNASEYNNLIRAIITVNTIFPKISLSELPRNWNDRKERIHKSHSGHREFSSKMQSL